MLRYIDVVYQYKDFFKRYFSDGNYIDVPDNMRVGTKRYLAPEVLDSSISRYANYPTRSKVTAFHTRALTIWLIGTMVYPFRGCNSAWVEYHGYLANHTVGLFLPYARIRPISD